jgi:hypothetical protein
MIKTYRSELIVILIASLFTLQIVLQSIPISERIIVNGDALCTCGCGHTISGCAANHSKSSNCTCQHDKEEETKIKFSTNKFNDFVLTSISIYRSTSFTAIIYNKNHFIIEDNIEDIILPPPKLLFT